MIHLKLRQAGLLVNYKRVERLYQGAKLQVRRRKRKEAPVSERQPLLRPTAANQVWSMDIVFDRTAEGRVLKCFAAVDDATHEDVREISPVSAYKLHVSRLTSKKARSETMGVGLSELRLNYWDPSTHQLC
jgi:hypothetical protein